MTQIGWIIAEECICLISVNQLDQRYLRSIKQGRNADDADWVDERCNFIAPLGYNVAQFFQS